MKRKPLAALIFEIKTRKQIADKGCPDFTPLEKKWQKLQDAITGKRKLQLLLDETKENEGDVCRKQEDGARAKKTLNQSLGKTCLLCGQATPTSMKTTS